MELTLSVIIACATAITAIIAPIFTATINNRSQLKLKNIDMFYKEKSDAYQKFCTTAPSYIYAWLTNHDDTSPTKDEYLKVHQLAYLMSDNATRILLDELYSYHFKNIFTNIEIDELFLKIIKSMNDDLTAYRKSL